MTSPKVEVLKPGTKVLIDDGRIEGVVIAVQIFPNLSFQYRVEWFNNGDNKDTWLYEFQIKVCPSEFETVKVGFHS